MLKNIEMLLRLSELTYPSDKFYFATKEFGARRWIPLRRLRGGGQSASSNLNMISWRHTVEYLRFLKLAFILCYFAKPMI